MMRAINRGGLAAAALAGMLWWGWAVAQTPPAPPNPGPPITGTPGLVINRSTSLEANHIVRASAVNLYAACISTGASAGWFMLFNLVTAPADGPVTPQAFYQVAANTTTCLGFPPGAQGFFGTGLVLTFSTTGPFTKTASATAAFSWQVQ